MTDTNPVAVQLVPVEPTPEMIEAGAVSPVGANRRHHAETVEAIWSAMLAAAPVAPAASDGEDRVTVVLASYCGGDEPACTDTLPCTHCLKMANVFRGEAFIGEFGAILAARAQPPAGYDWCTDMRDLPAAVTLIFKDAVDADGCEMVRFGLSTDAGGAVAWSHLPDVIAHPADPAAPDGLDGLDGLAGLADPNTVHINMLRGGIAKPTPAQIGHLYRGEQAREVVAEVMRQNPDAFAAPDGGARETFRKALMAYLFGACQPDNGGVFAWADDHSGEIADFVLAALRPAPDGGERERVLELFGDEQNGGFIRDLCYTVWNKARYGFEGGPGDWGTDTLPTVQEGVKRIRQMVAALRPAGGEGAR